MTTDTMKILNKITGGKLTLGKAIRAIRLAEGCSQGAFAKKMRTTQSYLSDIENDRKDVSAKKAADIARRLKYSERQFIRLALQDSLTRQGLGGYIIAFRKAA